LGQRILIMGNMGLLFEQLYYILAVFEAVEERFGIEITDVEAQEVVTFMDLIELIKKKEAENGSRL